MKSTSPIKNIFRNKNRYIILFFLFLSLVTCVVISSNMITSLFTFSFRVMEKYCGTLKINIIPTGCDIKKRMDQIKDDSFIEKIYYPGVETNQYALKLATRYRKDDDLLDLDPNINPWYEPDNPFSVCKVPTINARSEYGYKCVVILKDYRLMPRFQEYLHNIFKDITVYADQFYNYEDTVLIPSAQTNSMSRIFLIIIIAMLTITTIFTSIMYLSNRKYEFAVLCSVGMSKPKIMGLYIIETLTFMFFTSLAAIIAGQLIFIFGLSDTVKSFYVGLIDTSLPIANLLFFNGIAVLAGMSIVVVVTVLISMIYLLSFEPLNIFNKRYS